MSFVSRMIIPLSSSLKGFPMDFKAWISDAISIRTDIGWTWTVRGG